MKPWVSQSLLQLQSNRPVVAVALSFISGIGISMLCARYAFWGLAAGGSLLITASFLSCSRNRIPQAFILAQSTVLVCGMLTGLAYRDGYDSRDLRHLLSMDAFPLEEPVLFEGRVAEGTPLYAEEIETVIDLRRFRVKDAWEECSGKGILRIASPDPTEFRNLKDSLIAGAVIRSWAVWRKPDNFENPGSADRVASLARRGIFLLGRTKSPRLIESVKPASSNPLSLMSDAVHARVADILNRMRADGYGKAAALVASLMIGDYSALDNRMRETFQNAGCFHILVVSGLHVAWIAGIWLFFLKCLRIPERLRHLSAAAVILMFAWTVGFQAGITRCLGMFLLYLAGRLLVRTANPVNILFTALLLLLATDPGRLNEPGYQLSFLSVAAIVLTAASAINGRLMPLLAPMRNTGLPDRYFLEPGPVHRWGRSLRTRCEILSERIADALPAIPAGTWTFIFRFAAGAGIALGGMVLLSVAVQVWIAPLLALYFNRISWIAPLSNPVVVPAASLTLASGIGASLFADIPLAGPMFVRLAEYSATLLLDLTERIARIPGAWQRCPTPSAAWVAGGVLLLFSWYYFKWKRRWIPVGYTIILIGFLSFAGTPFGATVIQSVRSSGPSPDAGSRAKSAPLFFLTLLDVGEGDSIVIRFPNGRLWVLDAGGILRASPGGEIDRSFDIGEAVVSRYLWHGWMGYPDRIIISHTDIDHIGGVAALLDNFHIGRLDYPRCTPDAILSRLLSKARDKGIPVHPLSAGEGETVGEVAVRVLHPQPYPVRESSNEDSVVLSLSFNRFSALLTGDLEKRGETELPAQSGNLHCRLLKVAHHGSRSATSPAFLDAVRPRWAILSAGRHNPFGHPSPEVLARLHNHGAQVYQTPDEGAITFLTDGVSYEIRSYLHGLLERGELE